MMRYPLHNIITVARQLGLGKQMGVIRGDGHSADTLPAQFLLQSLLAIHQWQPTIDSCLLCFFSSFETVPRTLTQTLPWVDFDR